MRGAGRFNLRGKKSFRCSCGCCVVEDFRDEHTRKLHEKEIRDCVEDDFLYTNHYGPSENDDEYDQTIQRYA